MPRLAIALALLFMATGPALADPEVNKKVVLDFYEKGLNQKDFEAAARHFGPRYIQHNPGAPDGIEDHGGDDGEGRGHERREARRCAGGLQLFAGSRVLGGMKSFLKIFLLVCLALVALKLLPLTLALGGVMAIVLAGLVMLGFGVAVVLSPIWVPALVITGIVSLIVRTGRRVATP